MRELEDLKKFVLEATTIMAAIEENKEVIKALSTYATTAIDNTSHFLQANLESILDILTVGLVNTWGKNLRLRCEYIGQARKILVDSGFTPEEAYDILKDRNSELQKYIKGTLNKITEGINEEIHKQNKETKEESE